ncbi:ATPase [Marinobacter sp. R17]|uniref:ATPase n=1 Tax=Marinobacter sp. R17 TaxID=2484250 RepID=UPI000F4CC264|nr:ATPase [Marinobacter sp. R17]ROT97611.1 ATPase [Marinobacter sp. R17]
MEIKTFEDLIDWARQLHAHLARSLKESAEGNQNERASALLGYLSEHESELERITAEFEKQADPKAMKTRLYDFYNHKPFDAHRKPDHYYAKLSFDEIADEIFHFHDELMALYQALLRKAELREVADLVQELLDMEQNESMRLARQVRSMDDV